MRAVLDTNILVSGLLRPMGNERRALRMGLAGEFQILVSKPVFSEYELVLPRPELKLGPKAVEETLAHLRAVAEWIAPDFTVTAALGDEDDNRFLECAEAGKADYLVTGNKRHFPAQWKSTKIVAARQLLELIAPGAER